MDKRHPGMYTDLTCEVQYDTKGTRANEVPNVFSVTDNLIVLNRPKKKKEE